MLTVTITITISYLVCNTLICLSLVGLAATTMALGYGLWQMKSGNHMMSQKMMRLRVVAQGFTVFALLGGVALQSHRNSPKKELKSP